jgi:N-acetylmuramoyl-L-alanine amidase
MNLCCCPATISLVRKWWVWAACLLPAAFLVASTPPNNAIATSRITPELRASLTRDYEIEVVVTPHDGDAWSRLAKRVSGDGAKWEAIAAFNKADANLTSERRVHVPFSLLRPELQRQIVMTIFPNDAPAPSGWQHTVIGSGVEGESLWKIAEWFTGDGANYSAIRKANPTQSLSTRKGDVIVVPKQLLTAAFNARGEVEGENAASTTAEVRESSDDPAQRPGTHEDAPEAAVVEAAPLGQPSLTWDRTAPVPFAVYRLQKGEALYSSVAIRFTGRVYSKDVGDVVQSIVKFNGIDDVSKMPIGFAVKIPMELLLPEYLPPDDPTRMAHEEARRTSAKLAVRTRVRNLAGVTVILDPGHGGRDAGAIHDDVAESRYVYDVACRLKRILEKKSGAKVAMTTKSQSDGYAIDDDNRLPLLDDHIVLTTPRYELDDSTVGVNLRWYLANSIFGRAMKSGTPREKIVFISIHADSLHPSLRGAMAYIPGERYVKGSYQKSGDVYLTRAEVRERPVVTHSEKESLVAEGLSRDLAESIIDSFEQAELKVHLFDPVRDNVVRDGREWVPAVIRYNLVPTRLLLEICNLGNKNDRDAMKTKKWRESVAQAVYRGLVQFYDEREEAPVVARTAAR